MRSTPETTARNKGAKAAKKSKAILEGFSALLT